MRKEKLANYLIDVSKYIFTGVVIASFFRDFGDSKLLVYGFGFTISAVVLFAGVLLINKEKEKK